MNNGDDPNAVSTLTAQREKDVDAMDIGESEGEEDEEEEGDSGTIGDYDENRTQLMAARHPRTISAKPPSEATLRVGPRDEECSVTSLASRDRYPMGRFVANISVGYLQLIFSVLK